MCEACAELGGGEALGARPYRHGDHVLLEPFVVAHPRIESRRQHIDEAVLGALRRAFISANYELIVCRPSLHNCR